MSIFLSCPILFLYCIITLYLILAPLFFLTGRADVSEPDSKRPKLMGMPMGAPHGMMFPLMPGMAPPGLVPGMNPVMVPPPGPPPPMMMERPL